MVNPCPLAEGVQRAERLRTAAAAKLQEALRLLHGHRREALIAWARQINAEADRIEADWFRNGVPVR